LTKLCNTLLNKQVNYGFGKIQQFF